MVMGTNPIRFVNLICRNRANFIQTRNIVSLFGEKVGEKRMLATQIETLYNDSWKQRGVLICLKNHLQESLLKDQIPLLRDVYYSK